MPGIRKPVLGLLLVACAEDPQQPAVIATPPPGMTLDASALVAGQNLALEIYNAPPGAAIDVVASAAGPGSFCAPLLGGACLGLQPPIAVLGQIVANDQGYARLDKFVPTTIPLRTTAIQAVQRAPPPASLSNVVLRDASAREGRQSITVYDGVLNSQWSVEAWPCASGASPAWDLQATQPGASGSASVDVDLGCGGGYSGFGFDRRTSDWSWIGWMYPNQFHGVRFRFHHGSSTVDDDPIEVTVDLDQRRPLADYLGTPDPLGWYDVAIPFADLNADAETWHRFMFFNATTTGTPHFLIDRFEAHLHDDLQAPVVQAFALTDVQPDGGTLLVRTDEHTQLFVEASAGGVTIVAPQGDYLREHEVVLAGLPSSSVVDVRLTLWDHQESGPAMRIVTGGSFRTAAPDFTAPTLTSFRIDRVGATVATVCWTTDEAATAIVSFGTVSLTRTTTIDQLDDAHCVVLTGLTPLSTYSWTVTATDRWGNATTQPSGQPLVTSAIPSASGTVDRLGTLAPFPDELRGVALGNWSYFWGRVYPGDSPRLRELTRLIRPGVIRAAGGNWSNEVMWDRADTQCYPSQSSPLCQRTTFSPRLEGWDACGTAPVPVPAAYQHAYQPDEITSIVELADDVGADVMLEVNAATCDPAMWADMVEWANVEQGLGIRYWEIGNEFDYNGHMLGYDVPLGADYAARYVQYHDTLLAVDPSIRVVGPAASQHEEDPVALAMSDLVLPLLDDADVQADRLDVLSWHLYPWWNGDSPVTATDLLSWGPPGTWNGRRHLDVCAGEKRAWLDARGMSDTTIALTEFAGIVVGEPTLLNVNHAGALYAADVLPRLAASGVDMAVAWELYDDPDLTSFGLIDHGDSQIWTDPGTGAILLDDRFEPRPAWYAWMMLAQLFGTELVPTTSSNPDVPVWAARDPARPGDLWLLVVNLTDDSMTTAIHLGGWVPQNGARQWTLSNASFLEALDKEQANGPSAINGRSIDPSSAASIQSSFADIVANPTTFFVGGSGVLRTWEPYTVNAILLDGT